MAVFILIDITIFAFVPLLICIRHHDEQDKAILEIDVAVALLVGLPLLLLAWTMEICSRRS
jgi:hypothetical protein